jgi:alpha-beta hydrolase superfamily lysophospholipase
LLKHVRTGTLEIAYQDSGPAAGFPVLLMHGFAYDPRCYDEVVPQLVAAGYRAIVPYLRAHGSLPRKPLARPGKRQAVLRAVIL